MAIYYPLSAALVLFTNALQNPQSAEAISDVELIAVVIDFLNQSMELSNQLEGTTRIFTELNRIAGRLVRDTHMTRLSNSERYEESADSDSQNLPSASSRMLSTDQFPSPEAGYNLIPSSTSYPYGEYMPIDQSQDLYAADNSWSLPQSFPYYSADMWTEPASEDLFDDGYVGYI